MIRDIEAVLEELDTKKFVDRLRKYHGKQNWAKLAERVYEQCLLILQVIYEAKKSCYEARVQTGEGDKEDAKVGLSEITTNYQAMKARARNAYEVIVKKNPDDEILPKLRRKNILGPSDALTEEIFADHWVEHYVSLFHECWLTCVRAHADAARSQSRSAKRGLHSSDQDLDSMAEIVDDTTDWSIDVKVVGLDLRHFLRFSSQDNIRVPLRLRAVQSALAAASVLKSKQLRPETQDQKASKLGKLGQNLLGADASSGNDLTLGATASQIAQRTKKQKEQEAAALNHPNFLIENPDDLFMIVCASLSKDRTDMWVVTDPVPIASSAMFTQPLTVTYAPPHKTGSTQQAAVPSILDVAFSTNGRAQGPSHWASHPVVSTAIPNVPLPPPTIAASAAAASSSGSIAASREGWLSAHAFARLQTVQLGVYVVKIADSDGGDADFEVMGALGVCPTVRLIEIVEAGRVQGTVILPIQQFITADKVSPHFSTARIELTPRLLEIEAEEIKQYQRTNRWDLVAYRKCEQRIREAVRKYAKESQRSLIFAQMPESSRSLYTKSRHPERALLSLQRSKMHDIVSEFRDFLNATDDDAELQSEDVIRLRLGEDPRVHIATKEGRLIDVPRTPADDCRQLPVVITPVGPKILKPMNAEQRAAFLKRRAGGQSLEGRTKDQSSGGVFGVLPFSMKDDKLDMSSPTSIYNRIVSLVQPDGPVNINELIAEEQEKLLREFNRILAEKAPPASERPYPTHLLDAPEGEEGVNPPQQQPQVAPEPDPNTIASSSEPSTPTAPAHVLTTHAGYTVAKHGAVARKNYGHSRTGLGNGFMGTLQEEEAQCTIV